MSAPYFRWANAVVKEVLKAYPDKWFGCLAYDNLLEPPMNTPIHPRIMPYMTYDRMKWIYKPTKRTGQKVTRSWNSKTEKLGWYDYIYGCVYHIPRIYFHLMAEYYRFAAENGVSGFCAEAYPNWGEGPKLYVAAKLMWDPYVDVDSLLQAWYERTVGQKAAPTLAAYYRLWEEFWMKRILKGKWFYRSGQFLRFWVPDYLEQVTFDDISESRKLLETVIEMAETDEQKKRARLLFSAFEYYEASSLSYLGVMKGMREQGKPVEYYKKMHRKRKELVDAFEKDPVLVHPIRFDRKFSWTDLHPFNMID